MDNQFKVPRIPLVTSVPVLPRLPAKRTKKKKQSNALPAPPPVSFVQAASSLAPTPQSISLPFSLLSLANVGALPQLCPQCSKIMVDYLSPIQNYLKELINIVGANQTAPSKQAAPPKTATPKASHNAKSSKENFKAPPSGDDRQTKSSDHRTITSTKNVNLHAKPALKETSQVSFKSNNETSKETSSVNPKDNNQDNRERQTPHHHEDNKPDYRQSEMKTQEPERQNQDNQTISASTIHHQQEQQEDNWKREDQEYREEMHQVQDQGETTHGGANAVHDSANRENKLFYESQSHYEDVQPGLTQFDSSTPYAYVTIVYNNLSALNAIILANSIRFYNNQNLNILEDNDFGEKRIEKQIYIPLAVMLYGNVEDDLIGILHQVFDDVIASSQHETLLLNDEQLGIQQYKVHLWNKLADRYEKCLFLDSFTMVIGTITNIFLEYEELSACVDCFFPDNFNCSVFVFEPNVNTYKEIIKFGMQQKAREPEEISDFGGDGLDEMTLLNQFFANKWRKMSFIYNFVRNDMTYTQMPAYLRFGQNIRIVNFGHQPTQGSTNVFVLSEGNAATTQVARFSSPFQPWNYKFNLRLAELEDEPLEAAPVDNYIKFYLRCFIRRVWPLLAQKLAPSLQSEQPNRHEWTLAEMVQILGRLSGTDDNLFEHSNPFILRTRKKSWITNQMLASSSGDNDLIELQEYARSENEEVEEEDGQDEPRRSKFKSGKDDGEQSQDEDGEDGEDEEEEGAEGAEDARARLDEARSKSEWETGRVDWLGQHQSDKIISRLKHIIKK